MARQGPRTDDTDTRQEILDAARRAFGAVGFTKATIRRIAGDARVDPSLVHHYFGTKADLYAATIAVPIVPSMLTEALAAGGLEHAGRGLANAFFTIWDSADGRGPLLAMLAGAMTGHDAGLEAFKEFLAETLLGAIGPLIPFEDRDMRMTLAAGQLLGVALIRYVVKLEPLASAGQDEIVDLVAPRLQSYFTE